MDKAKASAGQKTGQKLRFAVLAADVVLLTLREGELHIRLIPVDLPPFFKKMSGLPGGLIRPIEIAEQTVLRLLKDKAGISPSHVYMEQLYTFDAIKRDPRGRVVAVAYLCLVPWESLSKEEKADGALARWVPIRRLPKLAYDHNEIVSVGGERLESKLVSTTVIAKLMPKEFTLTELENSYEAILGRDVDKRNFRKKILKLDILEEAPYKRRGQRSRPAQLYRFRKSAVMPIETI